MSANDEGSVSIDPNPPKSPSDVIEGLVFTSGVGVWAQTRRPHTFVYTQHELITDLNGNSQSDLIVRGIYRLLPSDHLGTPSTSYPWATTISGFSDQFGEVEFPWDSPEPDFRLYACLTSQIGIVLRSAKASVPWCVAGRNRTARWAKCHPAHCVARDDFPLSERETHGSIAGS
jgi:hypothetical protein